MDSFQGRHPCQNCFGSLLQRVLSFNPFMPPKQGVSGYFLLLAYFIDIPVLNANSVDPDQTPRSAASDLGLHCKKYIYIFQKLQQTIYRVYPVP